ncbi:hypothetical protein KJ693_07720 [bacterium]|nr:hypothetical protein [bacterium]MBU1615186.1 hypothetical protein [bacterium]
MRKSKVKEILRNPNTKHVILAIDILIILAMFGFAKLYWRFFVPPVYNFKGVQYLLSAKKAKDESGFLLSLKAKNRQKKDVTLRFASPAIRFVIKKEGKTIWEGAIEEEQTLLLRPGNTERFSIYWDEKDKEGELVMPGEYELEAKLASSPPISISTKIKVRTN